MNVNCSKCNLFVEDKVLSSGPKKFFRTTITQENKEKGERINKSIEVVLTSSVLSVENQNKLSSDYYYVFQIDEGFLKPRQYLKNGEKVIVLQIIVTKGKMIDRKPLNKKTNELKDGELPWND